MTISLVDSNFTAIPYNGKIYSSFPSGTFAGTIMKVQANVTGTQAWTFGQAFVKGDVDFGAYIQTNSDQYQVDVLNRWGDNSAKFVLITGIDTFTAGVDHTVTITTTPFPPTGTPLTETNLLSAMGSGDAVVTISGQGTVSLKALIGVPANIAVTTSNGRINTRISGAVMSEWHYRSTCGSSPHLRVYFYVKLYSNNQIEIETNIENGYINVPSPTNLTYDVDVTINGTNRYTQASLLHYYRSSWSLIHWWDGSNGTTDFQRVLPKHNWDYLTLTRLIPNYKYRNPEEIVLNLLIQDIRPMSNCNVYPKMATTGGRPDIGLIPQWDALCSSGDIRAITACIVNTYAFASFTIVVRDENTGRPMRFSQHPNTTGYWGQEKNWAKYLNNNPYVPDVAHNLAGGYMAYLLTGRWHAAEIFQFNVTFTYWTFTGGARDYALGVIKEQDRGKAWAGLRNNAMALVVTPDDDVLYDEFLDRLWNNINWMYTNSRTGGTWKNQLGMPPTYSQNNISPYPGAPTGYFACATWQYGFVVQAYGFGWDLAHDALTPARQTVFQEFRDFLYRYPVGLFGGTAATDCNYTLGVPYNLIFGYSPLPSNNPVNFFTEWSSVYSMFYGTNPDPTGPGGVPNPGIGLGGTIDIHGTGSCNPLNALSYVANCLPALTYAVSHNATGAAAAWERFKSATNFPNNGDSYAPVGAYSGRLGNYNNQPQFGIWPYGE